LFYAIVCVAALYLVRRQILHDPFAPRKKRVPKNATVVITGCDTGFGRMSCEQLAKQGCVVFAGCLTENGCKELAALGYANLKPVLLDVTDDASVKNLAQIVEKECPEGLFALINNAGINQGSFFDWTDFEKMKKVLDVNLVSVFRVTKALLPAIKTAKGRIINVASIAGHRALGGAAAYTAAKHGVIGFSKSLLLELYPLEIDVIAICPGFMKTQIVKSAADRLESSWNSLTPETQSVYGRQYFSYMSNEIQTLYSTSNDPQLVVDKLIKSVLSPRPKSMYFVGRDAFAFMHLWPMLNWIMYFSQPPFGKN